MLLLNILKTLEIDRFDFYVIFYRLKDIKLCIFKIFLQCINSIGSFLYKNTTLVHIISCRTYFSVTLEARRPERVKAGWFLNWDHEYG